MVAVEDGPFEIGLAVTLVVSIRSYDVRYFIAVSLLVGLVFA